MENGTKGEIRTLTDQNLNLVPLPIGLLRHGTSDRTRTDTEGILSTLPLPDWVTDVL